MAERLFCCSEVEPYRPDHEQKFKSFLSWARVSSPIGSLDGADLESKTYAIQFVKHFHIGPLESKRYFCPIAAGGTSIYAEVNEIDLINANFKKVNSIVFFRCIHHNHYFELDLYRRIL